MRGSVTKEMDWWLCSSLGERLVFGPSGLEIDCAKYRRLVARYLIFYLM